jgi:hypothetical protein
VSNRPRRSGETLYIAQCYATILLSKAVALRHNSAQTNLTRFAVQAEGMVTKRVNDTDPVIQVRLRVTLGNFRGAHRVRLVAGSVYHEYGFSKHNQILHDTSKSPRRRLF